MPKLKSLATLGAATAVAALMATGATAATLSLVDGVAGSVPGSGSATNDGLAPLNLGTSLQGFYGSQIWLDGPGKVTFTLLGSEATFTNTLTYSGSTDTLVGGANSAPGVWNVDGMGTIDAGTVAAGLLDFSFLTSGNGGGSVTNGFNTTDLTKLNFFASVVGDATGRSGSSIYLFFDDNGADFDDNHDDLVVLVSVAPIPVPAAGFLLVGGLGMLGVASRRRRRHQA